MKFSEQNRTSRHAILYGGGVELQDFKPREAALHGSLKKTSTKNFAPKIMKFRSFITLSEMVFVLKTIVSIRVSFFGGGASTKRGDPNSKKIGSGRT